MKKKFLDTKSLEVYSSGKTAHMVSPSRIKYGLVNDFDIDSHDEKIAGGDWDLDIIEFDKGSSIYQAYKDVFFDNKIWEDTDYYNGWYQAGTTIIEDRESFSEEALTYYKIARCRYLSFLYKAMRHFGYVQNPFTDFMSVVIGRNGDMILNNGRHRLAAAKLLKLKNVPILVDVRHSQWVDTLKSIDAYAVIHDSMIYAPIEHVDLKSFKSRQADRSEDVLSCINKTSISVVDLGANWGSMCKVLEDSGRVCTAVEVDDIEFFFLQKLRLDYKYDMVKMDICDFIEQHPKWDCILALSIFHHLAKTEEGYVKLIRLLNKLDCNEMIFQMPDEEEMKLFSCYRDYGFVDWMELIISESCLNGWREVGNRETRKVFRLWK